MSKSSIRQQLFINDGTGQKLAIATSTWVTNAVNIDEHRRLSLTIGVGSATGAAADIGGFTGTLLVQGTDELAQCYGQTGTQEAGNGSRPGTNGFTGARFWQTIPSGTVNITNTSGQPGNAILLSFTDVGVAFVRVAFNVSPTGPYANATACGSGTFNVFLTAKSS